MNLTKAEIVKEISDGTGITRLETETIVNAFIATIHQHLQQGHEIEIRGLGSFRFIERAARTTRNPKTGKKIDVPKRRAAKFRLSKELKIVLQ